MLRLFAALAVASFLFAQAGSKPKKKAAPSLPPQSAEEHYACNLDHGFHKCSCVAMVAEVQEYLYKKCEGLTGKQYQECIKDVPEDCQIIQKADTAHPAHTCTRSCTKAMCKCHDHAPCFGPSLTEGENSPDRNRDE